MTIISAGFDAARGDPLGGCEVGLLPDYFVVVRWMDAFQCLVFYTWTRRIHNMDHVVA